ncbi:MAG: hypothetical protein HDS75_02775 [Bacteroidales bacterium]|nr:hypothetical protein [Bacteroidales bacterium]MDE6802708.1 hypothetical protein [Muribaculaceae bacterium]
MASFGRPPEANGSACASLMAAKVAGIWKEAGLRGELGLYDGLFRLLSD